MPAKAHELEGAPFVVKTYQLVSDPDNVEYVSWSPSKDSFIVWKPVEFASELLPRYFKHNNFCSFIRQLNTYNFHKVENKQWEFQHDNFIEGRPELLKEIIRRKSKKRDAEVEEISKPTDGAAQKRAHPAEIVATPVHSPPGSSPSPLSPPPQASPSQAKMSPAPAHDDEVEKLREMNNILMKEIVRLQQQQDSTQDTIKQILGELIQSRKEQREIYDRVSEYAAPTPQLGLFDTNFGMAQPAQMFANLGLGARMAGAQEPKTPQQMFTLTNQGAVDLQPGFAPSSIESFLFNDTQYVNLEDIDLNGQADLNKDRPLTSAIELA
eukprot:TRINITY_DN1950_c0_g1_i1.p1 TRINITY_DN1950_c0_g1~~TRINITY_DN1950_c0_g1_i1.p1  ORF type:complete len:324 (-),score=58.83 TRINITY_DN1950_c0_g1_i1:51-1022(-)